MAHGSDGQLGKGLRQRHLAIIMVMRMLGEMAASNPATGSFADYARQSHGAWAGFSVGWL
jgi:GABA permease